MIKLLKYIIYTFFIPFWWLQLLIPRNKNLWVFGAWFGEKYSDNAKVLFEYVKTTNILTEEEKYQVIPLLCKYITTFYNVHENNIELVFFSNDILKLLQK